MRVFHTDRVATIGDSNNRRNCLRFSGQWECGQWGVEFAAAARSADELAGLVDEGPAV